MALRAARTHDQANRDADIRPASGWIVKRIDEPALIRVRARTERRANLIQLAFPISPRSRFNDAPSSRLMTSRSVAVSACPAAKFSPQAFSKSANECASLVAAYLCPFDAASIVQVRFHHSASLARG